MTDDSPTEDLIETCREAREALEGERFAQALQLMVRIRERHDLAYDVDARVQMLRSGPREADLEGLIEWLEMVIEERRTAAREAPTEGASAPSSSPSEHDEDADECLEGDSDDHTDDTSSDRASESEASTRGNERRSPTGEASSENHASSDPPDSDRLDQTHPPDTFDPSPSVSDFELGPQTGPSDAPDAHEGDTTAGSPHSGSSSPSHDDEEALDADDLLGDMEMSFDSALDDPDPLDSAQTSESPLASGPSETEGSAIEGDPLGSEKDPDESSPPKARENRPFERSGGPATQTDADDELDSRSSDRSPNSDSEASSIRGDDSAPSSTTPPRGNSDASDDSKASQTTASSDRASSSPPSDSESPFTLTIEADQEDSGASISDDLKSLKSPDDHEDEPSSRHERSSTPLHGASSSSPLASSPPSKEHRESTPVSKESPVPTAGEGEDHEESSRPFGPHESNAPGTSELQKTKHPFDPDSSETRPVDDDGFGSSLQHSDEETSQGAEEWHLDELEDDRHASESRETPSSARTAESDSLSSEPDLSRSLESSPEERESEDPSSRAKGTDEHTDGDPFELSLDGSEDEEASEQTALSSRPDGDSAERDREATPGVGLDAIDPDDSYEQGAMDSDSSSNEETGEANAFDLGLDPSSSPSTSKGEDSNKGESSLEDLDLGFDDESSDVSQREAPHLDEVDDEAVSMSLDDLEDDPGHSLDQSSDEAASIDLGLGDLDNDSQAADESGSREEDASDEPLFEPGSSAEIGEGGLEDRSSQQADTSDTPPEAEEQARYRVSHSSPDILDEADAEDSEFDRERNETSEHTSQPSVEPGWFEDSDASNHEPGEDSEPQQYDRGSAIIDQNSERETESTPLSGAGEVHPEDALQNEWRQESENTGSQTRVPSSFRSSTAREESRTSSDHDDLGSGAPRLLEEAEELLESDNHESARDLVQSVLERNPDSSRAQRLLERITSEQDDTGDDPLETLGSLDRVPTQNASMSNLDLTSADLDHRCGYVLSLVDGRLTFDDIIEISSMPREETLELLANMMREQIIET